MNGMDSDVDAFVEDECSFVVVNSECRILQFPL